MNFFKKKFKDLKKLFVSKKKSDDFKFKPYIRKDLIQQIIRLFREQPSYRDNRLGTVEEIVCRYYPNADCNVKYFATLVFDIDRSFRLIQQNMPELRGETWLKRQYLSGRISKDEYAGVSDEDKITNQLELF